MSVERVDQKYTQYTEELDRLLEIGKILASVLTPEELSSLSGFLEQIEFDEGGSLLPSVVMKIGNTSVT